MSLEQSDIGERLPLFEDYRNAIGDIAGREYEGIEPTITSMMTGCVPVGLRPDNTLAIPKTYEPEDGPPVLMLRSGENVTVRWSDGMEKALLHVLRRANITGPSALDADTTSYETTYAYLQGVSLAVHNSNYPERVFEPLAVPQYVVLRPLEPPAERSTNLLHECDHWDFYLNTAPHFSRPEATTLPTLGKSGLAEKRAYQANYRTSANTGRSGYFMAPEHLSDLLEGYDPTAAVKRAFTLLKRWRPPLNHMSTIAVALSMRFADADPSVAINELEVEAYRAAGII